MFQQLYYKGYNGARALRSWVVPMITSRLFHNEELRPLLCYLFTDWHCNIDCHYCFQFDNNSKNMQIDVAKESIDWLKTIGCRVIAIMGGEPLMRKDFILETIRYGHEQGFLMYIPTNGYLLDKEYIDDLGKAGVSAINLAVDCVKPRKGLPKGLMAIEPQFRYLVEQQKKYNYMVFFNINICKTNIKDVKMLTEIAHQNNIGTDYHLNEPPHDFVDVDHYQHKGNHLDITPDEFDEIDELLDWIIEKQHQGWPMINSEQHLQDFKKRMRGIQDPWHCRAGHNGALIKPDGSLSPCFDMITYDHDWGKIWKPDFNKEKLDEIKEKCMPGCSSTCFHTMASYYDVVSIIKWMGKHLRWG